MESGIAIIGIIVEDRQAVTQVNEALHEYAELIVGRMGIPYKEKGISVISIIVDGSNDQINALNGRLGRINGVSAKSMITKK